MQLTFASYNIHKGVGGDGRRDPERILAVLNEIDADVIALQEVDRRFGRRAAVLPAHMFHGQSGHEFGRYRLVPFAMRPDSMGWHGNALLVRSPIAILAARAVDLPTLEPRGAVCADLEVGGRAIRVVGMHLDLSGLRRRQQLRAVQAHLDARGDTVPSVLMGDFNEWSRRGGALSSLGDPWQVLATGRSFPARRPLAPLDRIVVGPGWEPIDAGVHHSPISAMASDHLPVVARLRLL